MRHYFKPAVVATLLLLVVFAPRSGAFCQSGGHFDWVKGYGTSASYGCYIRGSVTDSLGNLYILGQFRNDSEWGTGWDAERLLPMVPYGPWADNANVIIAKISPEGEMVWKKVIHSNNGTSNHPHDIKKVGDTAFACLVEMRLPTEDHYTYYLDTLIPDRSDYPVSSMYVRGYGRTAFIMFDFDGNVLEQHFLYVTYTDSAGNDIVKYYPEYSLPWYTNADFRSPSFDIDTHGNIYICRMSMDWRDDSVNARYGIIHGIKFWVDNRKVGECILESRPQEWYPQIMKFSPHFDTMLASRFLVQKNGNVEHNLLYTGTKIDANGNVNVVLHQEKLDRIIADTIVDRPADTIIIDSTQNIYFITNFASDYKDFVVQLSGDLTPNWVITLDDSVISTTANPHTHLFFLLMDFDYENNIMFLPAGSLRATFCDTTNFYSILTYRGMPLKIKNNAFFIAFDLNNNPPELYSYGVAPGIMESAICEDVVNGIIYKGNRVFMQSKFVGGMKFPGRTIRFSTKYDRGVGFAIFDSQGNVIGGENYNSISPNNQTSALSLHDSILYLMGTLTTDAQFGDIPYPIQIGKSRQVYIAKYVDTSFMTPYVPPTVGNITLHGGDNITSYPNPASETLTLSGLSEPIKEVTANSTSGVKTPVLYSGYTIYTASLLPGIYILEISTASNRYYHKFIKL